MATVNRLSLSLGVFCALGLATSLAQAEIRESFTGATAPGWTISDNSALTAPSIDPAGSGWLRLNPLAKNQTGRTLLTGANEYVPSGLPIYFEFEYTSWGGGTEGWSADGLTAYLYDASKDMAGALYGGSLSYCGGAGAYLAVGLDEWGNFSGPYTAAKGCSWNNVSADQRAKLDTVVIRGPQSASFPNVATAKYTAGVDFATATARPVPTKAKITMTPKSGAPGYTVTVVLERNGVAETVHNNVDFPYVAPSNIRVGFGSATGSFINNHEVRNVYLVIPGDLEVSKKLETASPAQPGSPVRYQVTYTNTSGGDMPPGSVLFADPIPAAITSPTWTCAGTACSAASGSGSINGTNAGLFAASGTAIYTINGTLSASATAGQVISNTAEISFAPGTPYTPLTKKSTVELTVANASVTPPNPNPPTNPTPVPATDELVLLLASTALAGWGALALRRRQRTKAGQATH